MRHRYSILEAPSALGHIPEHLGVERAPGVLLAAGLADGLGARRAGCLPAEGYSSLPDPRTKVMNPQPLRDYSRSLADAVDAIVDNGEFPVVLGGDCSLLLGTMLALRRRGRYGPDGLTWDEGIAVLRTAIASNQAAGLQVAIYNPDIDKDGSNGRGLAAAVRSAIAG